MSALAYAVQLVKKWEGCRLEAYPDPATGGAPWTIGYGATGPGIDKGVRWSQKQADDRLALDLDRFAKGVRSALRRPATDRQLGAMVSLVYNIGVSAFRSSTLLKLFNAGDVAGAAAQFPRWNRANGRVMQGLSNRRADERRVFEGQGGSA
ncbi:glycosidase [Stenotrophomonas maltophilia]|uniref:lysozyme n=1 Tax=Stenotrophomonas maltophilia TaxID=40324 RepID=UPI000DA2F103|nr:lysozyme [Stenotrophomonas maltophilia]SQG66951.1 glycosidase [Stenotrophomonas maltophilia]